MQSGIMVRRVPRSTGENCAETCESPETVNVSSGNHEHWTAF